jgi:ubiquinone biosynthesis protein
MCGDPTKWLVASSARMAGVLKPEEAMLTATDLGLGAFSDQPPWVITTEPMVWQAAVPGLRRAAFASVADLTSVGKLPPSVRMLTVAGRAVAALAPWEVRKRLGKLPTPEASRADISRRLRLAAERLGPTFIKLGQIISSGQGLFPEELVSEFKRCRDQVPAESFDVVRTVVEADLGRPIEAVFSTFDRTPLAAASIAQVHAATLHTGESVVVKVQRPDVERLVRKDIRTLAWLAPYLIGRIKVTALANPPALVELFAETISEELDFRIEAQNMLDVAKVLVDLGQRGYVVPRPHPTLVTKRVLVMERLAGFAFDDAEAIKAAGIDTHAVIRTGMVAFLEGAMIHGVFHGDLHGGNLFVMADGRTALLDFGITARLTPKRRTAFLRLLVGGMTNDVTSQVQALVDLGALPEDTDIPDVIRELRLDQATIDPTTLTGEEMVAEVQRVVKAMLGYGARLPKELMLYVKNLVFLDGAIAALAPDLDLIGEVSAISMQFASKYGNQLAAELGLADDVKVDMTGFKASLGLDAEVQGITYRELQARRELINKRMQTHVRDEQGTTSTRWRRLRQLRNLRRKHA